VDVEGGELVGIFPGSNASSRRWEPDRYAEVAARMAGRGARVVVFGSAGERELTAHVAGSHALDLGGRTDLPLLAAGLAACRVLVTNDSGPMHLAAAVGTPTVSVQGPADPRVTRPLGEGHLLVWGAPIPCVPCVKNECPRSGAGFRLPEAERECLRLIGVDEVEQIVLRQLSGVTT
jgi:ADP-heptose:LPS heptosyltransferase